MGGQLPHLPIRGTTPDLPEPADLPPAPLTAGQAAWVIRRLAARTPDLPGTPIPIPGAQGFRVVSDVALTYWLRDLADRVSNGEPL